MRSAGPESHKSREQVQAILDGELTGTLAAFKRSQAALFVVLFVIALSAQRYHRL